MKHFASMASSNFFMVSLVITFNLLLITSCSCYILTNSDDVTGLNVITSLYPNLLEDNADPCVIPVWSWIQCNSNYRVTALYLRGKLKNLGFGLFPSFDTMDALQTIDLSENGLFGIIPSFLGTFPYLQELNLDDNLLSGTVPDSLACNKNLKLSVAGNPDLYPSTCSTSSSNNNGGFYYYSSTSSKKNPVRLILGITIPIFVLISIVVGIFAIFRHKAKAQAAVAEAAQQRL